MASSFTPAGPPPPGVVPDYHNPSDTLYPEILATFVLSLSLTTLFTTARLYTKTSFARFSIEDYALCTAWALNAGYDVLFFVQSQAGLGRHVWDVSAADAVKIAKLSWALELLYCPSIWSAKAALLLQLQRTFTPQKSGKIYCAIQALLWGNLAFYTSCFFVVLFECVPQRKIWDPLLKGGHCLNITKTIITTSSVNIFSDLLILLLPIAAIWHLQMASRVKLGVSAVFAVGVIAFASSLGRLVFSTRLFYDTDSTYLIAQVAMWTLAEISSIILCVCIPMLPRFFKLVLGGKSKYNPSRSWVSYPKRGSARNYQHYGSGRGIENEFEMRRGSTQRETDSTQPSPVANASIAAFSKD